MLRILPTSTLGLPVFEGGDIEHGQVVYFEINEGQVLMVNGYMGNVNIISSLSGVSAGEERTPFTRIFMPEEDKVILIDIGEGNALVSEIKFTSSKCNITIPVSFFIIERNLYMLQTYPTECRIIDILNDKTYVYSMDYWPNSGIVIMASGPDFIVCRVKEDTCLFIYLDVTYNVPFECPLKNTTHAEIIIEGSNKIKIVDGDTFHVIKLPFLDSAEMRYIDIPIEDI